MLTRSRFIRNALLASGGLLFAFFNTIAAKPTPASALQEPSSDEPLSAAAASAQQTTPSKQEPLGALTAKQKRDLLKDNFEKMKRNADELALLAKSLQEDLDKSNSNVLSLDVVEKADKIEKLAKKIKSQARGM